MLKRVHSNTNKGLLKSNDQILDTASGQVVIDSAYLESVTDVEISVNQSNFTRVSPSTANADLTAVTQMIS